MTTGVEIQALVSRGEAAEILGVSVRSVDRLRERGMNTRRRVNEVEQRRDGRLSSARDKQSGSR